MSAERKNLLRVYSAEIVLTPVPEGVGAAIRKAQELLNENPLHFMPQQFNNPANPKDSW